MENKPLAGKVALVTGSGRGMGRSIALALSTNGAKVTLTARTESEIRQAQAEIEAGGGEALCVVGDVSQEAHAIELVSTTVSHFGRLDILVNNAGIGAGGPWESVPTADWDYVMAVNARAPFILCREAIPHLRKQGKGFIVNIISFGGVMCYEGYSTYAASKNALRALTITLSKDLRKENIRVHGINMGAVATPLLLQALDYRPELDPSLLIRPEEIADLVLFLVTWKGNGVIDEINIRRPDASYWAAV